MKTLAGFDLSYLESKNIYIYRSQMWSLQGLWPKTKEKLARVHKRDIDQTTYVQIKEIGSSPDQNEGESEYEFEVRNLGIVTFNKLSIDRHHTSVAFNSEDNVCTI